MPVLPSLIAIIGATGSGKTALAEELALRFKGELVSCDAKQVYQGMDIGTAKEKQLKVPQYLIDIKKPGESISVAEYQSLAYQSIDDIIARQHLPILVGGSMLYAEAITNGYIFDSKGKSCRQEPRYRVLKIGIEIERSLLKTRLAQRTKTWLGKGLLDEIKALRKQGVPDTWLEACGQEYRYFTRYLKAEISLEEAIELTNISLNQYVKRQYTWWRRHQDIHWVPELFEAVTTLEAFLREGSVV